MRLPLPITCDDVTRALTAPTADQDASALAEHLAACPRCADWAARDAALTRVWEATRPAEPSDLAWDAVWARVSERLRRPAAPAAVAPSHAPLLAHPWYRRASVAFNVAQAAAILAAVVLWAAHHRPAEPLAPIGPVALVSRGTVDIVPGQIVLIRPEGTTLRADEVPLDDSIDVEAFYVMFNRVEAGLDTQLARND
jgi:hypothetical protein